MTVSNKHLAPSLVCCWMILAALIRPAIGEELVDATAAYDSGNVFARILRGELPADVVFENEYALAFHDIWP